MKHNTKTIGMYYEKIAAALLKKHNYLIIATNYRTRFGEIDIICYQHKTIIFIEVKYRSSSSFGGPQSSISCLKQQKLIKTAQLFLCEKNISHCDCRFDVLCISGTNSKISIDWIKNAFT